MHATIRSLFALAALAATGGPALAQAPVSAGEPSRRPAPVVEISGGWSGFVDDRTVHHALGGIGARFYITPRVSVGPELQYMVGPKDDTDLIGTGNLVLDFFAPRLDRPRRTTPYLVVGGGFFRHTDRFVTGIFTSVEGAFTAGVGLRTWVNERAFVAADARVGWEAHVRVAATVGLALR